MNYYLDDLRTVLSTNNTGFGYTGYTASTIFVDRLIEPSTLTSVNNFILLQAQGGSAQSQVIDNRDFAVFVYRSQPQNAEGDATKIWNYLNGWSGGLGTPSAVQFRRITTRQSPMPFNSQQVSGVYIYMFTMTAQINNSNLLYYK